MLLRIFQQLSNNRRCVHWWTLSLVAARYKQLYTWCQPGLCPSLWKGWKCCNIRASWLCCWLLVHLCLNPVVLFSVLCTCGLYWAYLCCSVLISVRSSSALSGLGFSHQHRWYIPTPLPPSPHPPTSHWFIGCLLCRSIWTRTGDANTWKTHDCFGSSGAALGCYG